MAAPEVSILIPTYNCAAYLPDAIESALRQTYQGFELIVVDDGSTDDTPQVLEKYADRLRVIRQENQGAAAALNAGARVAQGDFIARLDADDVWLPAMLERLVGRLKQAPHAGFAHCSGCVTDSQLLVVKEMRCQRQADALTSLLLYRLPTCGGSSFVFRRECLDSVGLWDADLRICEDTDLWIRLAARYTLECVEEPLILYRQHGGNIHRDYGNLLQQNLRMLRKTFADPALPPHARRLRKRSFSRLYLMVSGCYVEQGNWWAGVRCALKATAYHLPSAAYVLGFPLRRLSQWINGSMRTSCPRQ